ncbi:MAG: hypothetical protein V7K64_22840 [Nostoc sp.]|nr:hypothetical protein [Nostoc sp. JL34]
MTNDEAIALAQLGGIRGGLSVDRKVLCRRSPPQALQWWTK